MLHDSIKLCLELYLFHPLSPAFCGEKHKDQCYSSYECSYLSGNPAEDYLLLNTSVIEMAQLYEASFFLFFSLLKQYFSVVFFSSFCSLFLQTFSYSLMKMSVSISLKRTFMLFSVLVKRAWKDNTLPQKHTQASHPGFS